MDNEIISLNQVSKGNWQAKYRGNYGVYNIEIQLNEDVLVNYSCSCPSDYYSCKHIGMIIEEIQLHNTIYEFKSKPAAPTIDEILKKISHKELVDFIIQYSAKNEVFIKKIQLEFLSKFKNNKEADYAAILKMELKKVYFDYRNMYNHHEDCIEIEIIDEWLEKAEVLIGQHRTNEAIAILKAIIEEYSIWSLAIEEDILERIDTKYSEHPLCLLLQIAKESPTIANELFEYAIAEIQNPLHEGKQYYYEFINFLINVATTGAQFSRLLAVQYAALNKLENKESNRAEFILNSIIRIHEKNGEPDKVAKIIEDNLQIRKFKMIYLEQKIAEGNYVLAKKILTDTINYTLKSGINYHWEWNKMLLDIARLEGDQHAVRCLAYTFIDRSFDREYYKLYKSTFSATEWPNKLSELLNKYDKNVLYFSESKANVLVEEGDLKGLILYIETHLTADRLEKYYSYFVGNFPEVTLDLFCIAISKYLVNNTGRSHYEYVVRLLMKMKKIDGGIERANVMVRDFKIVYKNRRAMMEILQAAKL